jgi:hypothetical protein
LSLPTTWNLVFVFVEEWSSKLFSQTLNGGRRGSKGATTFGTMTFSITTLSVMTFSIMTVSIMTFGITTLT